MNLCFFLDEKVKPFSREFISFKQMPIASTVYFELFHDQEKKKGKKLICITFQFFKSTVVCEVFLQLDINKKPVMSLVIPKNLVLMSQILSFFMQRIK